MKSLLKIDIITCLLLDKRLDLWDGVRKSISGTFGIEPKPFLVGDGKLSVHMPYSHIDVEKIPTRLPQSTNYPTWYTKNCYNAYLSHKKILEQIYQSGEEILLLIEDDIIVEDDFVDIWNNSSDFFQNNKWDMLYFGCYHSPRDINVTPNVYKLNGAGGWHGVLMQRHMIPEILKYGSIGPMDEICGRFIHPKFNCYGIYPSIISQQSGYSFVERQNLIKPSRYSI